MEKRYYSYSDYLIKRFGYKIFRVGVDGGFSCPNRSENRTGGCVYCDAWGAASAYIRTTESGFNKKSELLENPDNPKYIKSPEAFGIQERIEHIKTQIERGKRFLERRYKAEHFALYFQAFSNTYDSLDVLREVYTRSLEGMCWDALIISTRPDCIDREKLDFISSLKNSVPNISIELGLQSGSDEILKKMGRGHTVEDYICSAELVKSYNLRLCTHVILGFPSEEQKDIDKTVSVLNNVKTDAVKIHNLNITVGTPLYQLFLDGKIKAPTVKEHIDNVVYLLRRISEDVVIERLICETPMHRLADPRTFPDKNNFLIMLNRELEERNVRQGDLYLGENKVKQ